MMQVDSPSLWPAGRMSISSVLALLLLGLFLVPTVDALSRSRVWQVRAQNSDVARSIIDFADLRLPPYLVALSKADLPFDSGVTTRALLLHAMTIYLPAYGETLCRGYGR